MFLLKLKILIRILKLFSVFQMAKRKSFEVLKAQVLKLKNKGFKTKTITTKINDFNGPDDQISYSVRLLFYLLK
jgi:hypothetical protein